MKNKETIKPTVVIQQITTSFKRFTQMESASGVVLIICAVIAMIWANSGWATEYFALWQTTISLGVHDFELSKPLILWINDGLMAIFFFLVGLEIKREVVAGELSSLRQALLPLFAAVGGMLIPAGIFLLLQQGRPGSEGWGIPMATDIAFSLGILMLLGKRAPLGLKIFLTAFAIVDDIGAVLIIAFFYSGDVQSVALLTALAVLALLILINVMNVRAVWPYIIGGIVIWYFFLKSGIHPTVAGVLVALVIPANRKWRLMNFLDNARDALNSLKDAAPSDNKPFLNHQQIEALETVEEGIELVRPPLQKLEHSLHGFVAFAVMPIFALANAGVAIRGVEEAPFGWLTLSIIAGLVIGKSVGVALFSWIGVRLGLCDLPDKVTWRQVWGVGLLGGVGFTMALFIANLGLTDETLLNQAKMGILLASVIAGTAGYLLLRSVKPGSDQ